MRITVDTGRCVGAGQCVLTAPDLFDQDDDGLVTVLDPTAGVSAGAAREAAALCPSGAISVAAD
ncbi:ferredoxin [Streptomyces noursei]|uniref:ferredoxin n=1 Tax=Streptomyces noursei TaxID=1971 RepID=UPI00045EE835|nr:ferredoxin [Streptomyces noursei]AIA08328.1 ferredoxin [Streptomyces noursei]AVX51102.1 nysM [Streptomyces noursei]